MNKKIELNIDAEPWITEDGVEVCVWIGEEEPTEYHYTWDELIELITHTQLIHGFGNDTVFSKKNDSIKRLQKIAQSLESGASRIYELLDDSYIFDREGWLEHNNGEYNQENKEQFLTKLKGGVS